MSIQVVKVFSIVEGDIIVEDGSSSGKICRPGDMIGALTNFRSSADPAPWQFTLDIRLSDGKKSQTVRMPIEQFASKEQAARSRDEPISFDAFETGAQTPSLRRFWLFRDAFYAAARVPRASKIDEVILRIKALHFERDAELRRLREQVANLEAVDRATSTGKVRQPLPDDVKLLVWTRDGGRCVKCGAAKDLHFDHIIPLARGGGDHAENIQLLCRACNLGKGARLT
jgi:5-methylcytosine-specific restriction endonuclease McrA